MALLKYFKRIEPNKSEKIDEVLAKTDGPLSTLMPTSAIQAANKAIRDTLLDSETSAMTETDGRNFSVTKRRGNFDTLQELTFRSAPFHLVLCLLGRNII